MRLVQFSAEPSIFTVNIAGSRIGQDITERERAEKEREQLLEKEKAAREDAEAFEPDERRVSGNDLARVTNAFDCDPGLGAHACQRHAAESPNATCRSK